MDEIKGNKMESGSWHRMRRALTDYHANKAELEGYFDYGEDTDRIQGRYDCTWLEAAILGFAMRLNWTTVDLHHELAWVCGIGPEPLNKGGDTKPRVREAPMAKKLDWHDLTEAKVIYNLALKQKEADKEIDEPLKAGTFPSDLSPVDQAYYMAGLYARHKPTSTLFGTKYSDLMLAYVDLAKAIELEVYGRTEAAGEYREEAPYHKAIPSDLYYYSTTIEKHYYPSSACHKGSVRVLKPSPGTLVYIGCLKKHKWDDASSACSPNPTVLMTIVLNNKKNREEAEHLKLVHPEIKEHHKESERGVEPRMGEGQDDRIDPALDQAMKDAEEV